MPDPAIPVDAARLADLLRQAKHLAQDYYDLTARPLGVTGEVAEYEAVRLLDLTLAPVRQEGYDATRKGKNGAVERLQIKGRRIAPRARLGSEKLNAIRLDKEWDLALMVLLDLKFNATVIYEATRAGVTTQLERTNSKAHRRGVLAASEFIRAGRLIWTRES